jgi:integrase
MCLYLTKRNGTYYFRRAIPEELQPFILTKSGEPRTEFTFSLRTKDKEEAKRRRSVEALDTDRLLDEARARLGSPAPPERGSTPISEAAIEHMDAEQLNDAKKERRRENASAAIDFLNERLKGSTEDMPPEVRTVAYIVEEHEFDKTLLRDEITRLKAEVRSLQGGAAPTSAEAPLRPEKRDHGARSAPAAPVPLLATFDAYAAAQGLKPVTKKDWRARMQDLIGFLGHDDAALITEDDVQRWRDHLLKQPGRGGNTRDPRTVRGTYISALRATLGWAVEERKLPKNVAASIVVRVPTKGKLRERDFTSEETRRILEATLEAPASNIAAEYALARRWIPWLCAYTGARVNEISQLRAEDVTQMDGVWVVRITPEAGTVKANIARTVPLHPHLVEQGFPAVVQAKGEGPLFYDPAKQRVQGADNRHYKKVGEHLAQWVRRYVGITDPNVQPNHGWRHTFKSLALAVEMPERLADYIQGHAPNSVGRTYGSPPLSALVSAIEKLPRFGFGS